MKVPAFITPSMSSYPWQKKAGLEDFKMDFKFKLKHWQMTKVQFLYDKTALTVLILNTNNINVHPVFFEG